MNVSKQLNIELGADEWQMLHDGQALRVPYDEEQLLVIHPPREFVEDEHE